MLGVPSRHSRILVAVAAAAIAGGYVMLLYARLPATAVSDFDAAWAAAQALGAGADPYAAIQSPPWPWSLQYPLPAVLVAWPVSFLPLHIARGAFIAASVGLLAYAASRTAWWPLLMLLGGPMLVALNSVQWTPLLTGAVLAGPLGAVLAAKPTTALPLLAAYPRRSTLLGIAALTALAFAVRPDWGSAWLRALGGAPHTPAILRPGGVVLLLALLRWRLPESRQLAALAIVPLSPHLYEALPLALVARSRREMLALAVCGTLGLGANYAWPAKQVPDHGTVQWLIVFLAAYLPALVIVLRRPRHAGAAQAPFEPVTPASA
jgi:hypothetical protein